MASITPMEGSVSNVQFTERKKGFDPDEVANYLHHIDDKIAGLRAMATEAVERAEMAEERARLAERQAEQATASGGGDTDDAARAASVLTMAQRTADATVSEARTEAARLLAAATTEAGQQSAATEAQTQQMLADARREMEAARAEHLDALRADIAELEQSRAVIVAEVDAVQRALDEERGRLRQAAAGLVDLADSPTGFAGGRSATVSGAMVGDSAGVGAFGSDSGSIEPDIAVDVPGYSWIDPGTDPGTDPEHDDESGAGGDMAGVGPDDAPVGAPVGVLDDAPAGEVNDPPVDAPVDAPVDMDATAALSGLFDDDDDDDDDPAFDNPEGEAGSGWNAADDSCTVGGYADSYGVGRSESQAAEGESSLGPIGEDDDAAMRAFFERDDDADGSGSRWGRRRR